MVFDARDLHRVATTTGVRPVLDRPDLLTAQRQFLKQNAPHRDVYASPARPPVYLNVARWLIDCPHCNNSCMVLGRDAACFGCGAVFHGLERPEHEAAIVAIVSLRQRLNHRNWHPGETLAELRQQNLAHGDPVPAPGEAGGD